MAEIVLSTVLTVIFEKLSSETVRRIVRAKGIQTELKKWERSLSQIQALLNDASHKEITDEAVKRWLNGLQHLAYDIDDMLDGLATEDVHRQLTTDQSASITSKVRMLIPTCCTSFSLSTNIHGKLDDITTKLQDLLEEKNTLGLIVKDGTPRSINRRVYETSLVDASSIVGRDGDKQALLHKLLQDEPTCNKNFTMVPIVGMGGLGKTTLARILYDETLVKNHFELKAWVCVSDEFDLLKISNSIFQSVAMEEKKFDDLDKLQVALREKLSNRKFLIVLDDVWSESYAEWEILERPFLVGAPGSKIVMTTRKLSLLTQLGYNQPHNLQSLSHDDALSLFAQHALGVDNFDSHPTLRPHGEGIVKKCDGLPLALITLGRLLKTKVDAEDWEELLNSNIWRLQRGGVLPALRLSYNDLSACLKQLFAYCSLFPKDHLFDKEGLVLLWMAEGFLHQANARKSMERFGLECFEDLLSRSFFQRAPNEESSYVMHDLMNDLATYVAGDFFLRLDGETEKELRKEALEKYRHMSFIREKYGAYTKFKVFETATNLRTFLSVSVGVKTIWDIFFLSNKILVDVLPKLPLLRVLCLSEYEIKEVPEFIGSLLHLRYLNLSRTRIKHLPENVCNLYNLQTLIVFGCQKLTKLPNSFTKLKNLRHFDIGDTPLLDKMPLGIGELKSLQTLSKIIIAGDEGFAITELKDLKNLHGKMSIKGLDKVQIPMHAQEANLWQKRLTELVLEWSDVSEYPRKETFQKEVLNMLKPRNDTLKKLGIVSYGDIEFPNWVGDPSFDRLTHVALLSCNKCTSLPPLGQLLSLKELFIEGMDKVKDVGSELIGTTRHAFASLEILSFKHMLVWEEWFTKSVVVDVVFQCLQELHIKDCPKLFKISLEALPSLRVIKLKKCGDDVLRSLVHVCSSSIATLEMDSISGLTDEVWGGVIKYLGKVEEVKIGNCNEIRYLWESEAEASKVLVNLKKLEVSSCSNLVSLGEKEEDNCGSNLTSIRRLEVWFCPSMKRCYCPTNIETLWIVGCDSLISVSFPTGGGKKVKSLSIEYCEKLLEKELGGKEMTTFLVKNTSLPMLENVEITCCPNLKSIIELNYYIHLTRLTVQNCPNMESFPDHELQNLTSLKHLTIHSCPSINASFPRGLWPPKLCTLRIGGLKRPISKWGSQNFPTSLVELYLSKEEVNSFSQLSHILPKSLTSLEIKDFENLESLSVGLQHLTSLQLLFVKDCPKVKDLPEMLLPSFMHLVIYGCPNLMKWSRRTGSYWPLISHIPYISIKMDM